MSNTNETPSLHWEELNSSIPTSRARVPSGWFVRGSIETSPLTFYPDPEHQWDGGSLNDYSEESLSRQWVQASTRWQTAKRLLSACQSSVEVALRDIQNPSQPIQDRQHKQAAGYLKELREQLTNAQQKLKTIEGELTAHWKELR